MRAEALRFAPCFALPLPVIRPAELLQVGGPVTPGFLTCPCLARASHMGAISNIVPRASQSLMVSALARASRAFRSQALAGLRRSSAIVRTRLNPTTQDTTKRSPVRLCQLGSREPQHCAALVLVQPAGRVFTASDRSGSRIPSDGSEPNDGDASARSSDQAMASANGRA